MEILERDAGVGGILYLDCFSGLSVDMIMSALLDLGVPLEVVESAVSSLPIEGYRIRVENETRRSVRVTRFFVDVDEKKQPHRHFSGIREMIEQAKLEPGIADLAIDIFRNIAVAEARVHGSTIEQVHFHEVGAVDSIVDIVGIAAALNYLGARLICAPVPLGKGFVETQHGTLPVPAPATMFILKGVPVEGTEVEAELTTPTGAAIVKTAASEFGPIPKMIPQHVGFGAGARSHEKRSGILRAILGLPVSDEDDEPRCWVIEANMDDITGEIAASAMEGLFEKGALDAWIETIQMKKGRPALKMSVLCNREDLESLGAQLMRETTTIGLRYHAVGRMEMSRSVHRVDTPFGPVRVKVARGPGGSLNAAPEFEDCKRAALEHRVPLKRVMAEVAGIAQQLLDTERGGEKC